MCDTYKDLVAHNSNFGSAPIYMKYSAPVNTEKFYKCNNTFIGLIVGGEKTAVGEFPHQAAIGWKSGRGYKFLCGGSLISSAFVLTVAHCARNDEYVVIRQIGNMFSATYFQKHSPSNRTIGRPKFG